MTDPNEALARRAQQVEAEAQAYAGDEEVWKGALKSLTHKLETGELTPHELQQKLMKQSAAGDL